MVCFKLRTGLEVFPVVGVEETRTAAALEDRWVEELGEMLPSLRRIHIGHSYSEQLNHSASSWYTGERVVRYRESPGGVWSRGCWMYSAADNNESMHVAQGRLLHNPRTTEKVHFDAWGSDGEYSEHVDYGW